MVKSKGNISKRLKDEIISKLLAANSLVPDLSKSYGISSSTLYKWRHKAKKKKSITAIEVSKEKFVELLVEEPNSYLKESTLQKASLIFSDFSISIEGRVSSSKFISILKILEEPC